MENKVFLDTNVLIYAYSKTEPHKRKIALEILEDRLKIVNPFK